MVLQSHNFPESGVEDFLWSFREYRRCAPERMELLKAHNKGSLSRWPAGRLQRLSIFQIDPCLPSTSQASSWLI